MRVDCLLCGVGGQGTVLASRILAQAAMERGMPARTAETIGMAQRGGCVVSHVRIGEGVLSPLIPPQSADVLIGFEPGEAVRCLPYLKEGGLLVVSDAEVMPVTASLSGNAYEGADMIAYLRRAVSRIHVLDAKALYAQCGTGKVLNVALLGAAAETGALGIACGEIESALKDKLPEKLLKINQQALRFGAALV